MKTLILSLITLHFYCFICCGQELVVNSISDTIIRPMSMVEVSEKKPSAMDEIEPKTQVNTYVLSMGYEHVGVKTGKWTYNKFNYDRQYGCELKVLVPNASIQYRGGKIDGEYISFYSDSTIKSVFTFNNGRPNGMFRCYTDKSVIVYSGDIDRVADDIYCLGREYYSTGSFKNERRFLIETLIADWMNIVE